MNISNKIQKLRKSYGWSQEEMAEKLSVSRQAVGKWESGQSFPEINKLIEISDIFAVPVDRLIRDEKKCDLQFCKEKDIYNEEIIMFLLKVKKATYAGNGAESKSSRLKSHDLEYQEGRLSYYDTYVGGERFSGEEVVWTDKLPIWAMNYTGRIIEEGFSGEFLKKALSNGSIELPYRGPVIYIEGSYSYHCNVSGDFSWYQGYEEILLDGTKIYECYFHGGLVK